MRHTRPSWNQLHRLGLTATEHQAGLPYNPHHATHAVQVEGNLDLDRLAMAWQLVQHRHPVLLTGLEQRGPVWRLDPCDPAPLGESRLGGGAAEAARAALAQALRAPFDLSRGPLARLHAVRCGPATTLVGIAVEHVVCDGWSIAVLARDLWTAYQHGELPAAEHTDFPAFVVEQYRTLDSAQGRAELDALASRLHDLGPLPQIRFPGFRDPGRPVDHAAVAATTFEVAPPDYRRLRGLGGELGMSPIGLVNAALLGAAHDLTGEDDLGVVLSVANRSSRALRSTVGWISGKVVVAVRARHHTGTLDYLRDVAAASAFAFDHAHLPIAATLHEMAPELVGVPCPHPWVAFNPMPATVGRHLSAPAVPGLVMTEFAVPAGWYDASVAVSATDHADRVSGRVTFKTDWYDAPAIAAVRDRMVQLLQGWAALGARA